MAVAPACAGTTPTPTADRSATSAPPTATAVHCEASASTVPGSAPPTTPPAAAPGTTDGTTGGTTDGTTAGTATATGPEIVVWHTYANVYLDLFHEFVARFTATHPGVRVRDEHFDGAEQLEMRLRHVAVDQYPDVVLAPETSVRRFADSGQFLEADTCLREAGVAVPDLLPVIRRTWSLGPALWAIPVNVSAPLLWYSPKALAAAGVREPPHDRAGLEDAARRIVQAGGRSGLVVDQNMAYWLTEQWAAERDQPLLAGSATTLDPAAKTAVADDLAWLARMERDHLAQEVGANPSGNGDLSLLLTLPNPAGMAIHSSAALGVARTYVERGTVQADDLRVAPLPGPGPGALVGGAAAWITARPGHERATAAAFASFLAAPAQQATLNARGGYVPVTAATLTEPELVDAWARYPQLRVAYDQAAATADTEVFAGPQFGPRREVRDVLRRAYTASEQGTDPTAALTTAEADITPLLQAYAASH